MFWLDDDDELHPISFARYSRLFDRNEPAPEFAGKVARFVQVQIATSNRRVTGIDHIGAFFLSFDNKGFANKDTHMVAAMSVLGDPVEAKRYRYEFTLNLTPDQLAAVRTAVLGES
jgi:hypothetical protein